MVIQSENILKNLLYLPGGIFNAAQNDRFYKLGPDAILQDFIANRIKQDGTRYTYWVNRTDCHGFHVDKDLGGKRITDRQIKVACDSANRWSTGQMSG
ncbi:hypothetical protein RO3G_16785 [Rhizopus delemar RA 99-880]|uniref:Uncharacterized protein n=1 Tax=Rhizopus delemar (strain RA 99-880 / ATCC MYA-4621 / FGSC 9543 / NRRL 43880) TaxID=246409 RepID=I1CUE4_RHIO9|nr:hypothetical protein RO3G_16785 [Rhizopus delemar RA 99-880]|eukprot:EIE92074.1 hypothetical protein RO3G_16785 [Rhizopus delemar RA 99-880]